MKTILAPVDFSEVSLNALSFAAEMAHRGAAHLLIVHCIPNEKGVEASEDKLFSIISDLKQVHGAELNCDSVLIEGNLIEGIERTISVEPADIIVMGTKGASGLKKLLIGSNTVKVIANIDVPVLVIPEVARFSGFQDRGRNDVVLASDLELLENGNLMDVLKEIALLIADPKMKVLNVRKKGEDLSDPKREERASLLDFFGKDLDTERITVFSDNVINGIEYYLSRNKKAGLVAMVSRDSGELFQKHYTWEMAAHTNVPLLVLPDVQEN